MKKLILLGALSVLLYSAPGYTGRHHKKKTLSSGQQALALKQTAEKAAAERKEKKEEEAVKKEAAWQALVQDTLPVGVAEEAALREKAEECQAVKARVETQAGKFRAANDIVKQLNAQLEGTAAKLIDAAAQFSVQLPETQLDKMKEELEQLNVKFADAKKYRDLLCTKTEGAAAEANNAYEEFKKMNAELLRVQAAAEEAAQATTNKEQLSTSEEKTASLKAVVAAEKEAAEKVAVEKEAAAKRLEQAQAQETAAKRLEQAKAQHTQAQETVAKRLEQAKAQHTQAQETVEKARVEYQDQEPLVWESLILQGVISEPLEAQMEDAWNKIRAAEREEKTRGEAVNALWKQEKEVRAAAPVVPSAPPVPFAPPAPAEEVEAERDAM